MPHWLFNLLGLKADERGATTLTKTKTTTRTVVTLGIAGVAVIAAAAFGVTFGDRRTPSPTVRPTGSLAGSELPTNLTGAVSPTDLTGIAIPSYTPCASVRVTAGTAVTASRAANAPIGRFTVTASPARCAMDVSALTVNVTSNISLAGVTANTITAWAGDVTAGRALGGVQAITWGRHTIAIPNGRRLVFNNAPLTVTVTANTTRATAGQTVTASVTAVTSRPATGVTAAPSAGVTANPNGIVGPADSQLRIVSPTNITGATGVTSITWIVGPDWNTAVTAARITF